MKRQRHFVQLSSIRDARTAAYKLSEWLPNQNSISKHDTTEAAALRAALRAALQTALHHFERFHVPHGSQAPHLDDEWKCRTANLVKHVSLPLGWPSTIGTKVVTAAVRSSGSLAPGSAGLKCDENANLAQTTNTAATCEQGHLSGRRGDRDEV